MRWFRYIWYLCLLAILSGCSNTRFLADDQLLYTGRNKVNITTPQEGIKTIPVRNYVETITSHKVNNSLFDRRVLPPVGLWVHNYMKEKEGKKFRNWLYKSLSSAPVMVSDVNPELRSSKIENDLFDKGYFNTRAWSEIDTSKRNKNKARVTYFIDLAPPVFYNKVSTDSIIDHLDTIIRNDKFLTEIKAGDQFNLEKIKASRLGLARRIQDSGYFYFAPEHIELKADTIEEKNRLNLLIGKSNALPKGVTSMYKINSIAITDIQKRDSSGIEADTIIFDGISIISAEEILKSEPLANAVYFRSGDTYSHQDFQRTINRLNNLGVFKYVNVSFNRDAADSTLHLLDARIDIIKADNIMFDFEANLTNKSSGYTGPLFTTGISHGNIFRGAERLRVGLTGGFEWQWGTKSESQLGTYSYQLGINTSLTIPRISIPFIPAKRNNLVGQRTSVNYDYSLLNRVAYYKMVSAKAHLQYHWSKTTNINHSFSPVYVNSVNLLETTPAFDSVVYDNIYIRKSFEEQFIIGPRYDFIYDNTSVTNPNNIIFQTGIATSGNVIDLFTAMGKDEEDRPYTFLNNIYSQFVKFTSDFRYYRNGYQKSLVLRLYAGLGIPYGNSSALPYVEQFFTGGAYSNRGFTARYLGPGSYHEEDQSGYIDQSGDIKLEANFEFRFDMSKVLKGALFVDAGNIWLVNEDINRPGANFDSNTFYEQIAVSAGFGLRFDFTFFVLRTDVGFPIRNPYPTNDKYWLFGTDKIFSASLFHLAIGYPF